ncbi:glycosyltransferase [Zhouia sp. PK063]|uniref:glycosyltransferase n=1 Tax=Zhouia sp. PK063 TaxID=3373602 RepID=UPI0037B56E57
MELVSVYITTRNRPNLLERALNSVLNQTYRHIEIIIVDDCSDKDLSYLIDKYNGTNNIEIFLLRNDTPKGACHSRNRAITIAKGKYLTGLDDDDEFVPTRIEVFIKNYNHELSFIGANDKILNPNGKVFLSKRPENVNYKMVLSSCENLVGNQIFTEVYKWREAGGFDEQFPALQDFEAYFRIMKNFGAAKILSEPLQIIYKNDDIKRITTRTNQLYGLILFYFKYKNLMNELQKKRFIIKYRLMKSMLLKQRSHKINIIIILLNSNRYSLKRNLKFFLSIDSN